MDEPSRMQATKLLLKWYQLQITKGTIRTLTHLCSSKGKHTFVIIWDVDFKVSTHEMGAIEYIHDTSSEKGVR